MDSSVRALLSWSQESPRFYLAHHVFILREGHFIFAHPKTPGKGHVSLWPLNRPASLLLFRASHYERARSNPHQFDPEHRLIGDGGGLSNFCKLTGIAR